MDYVLGIRMLLYATLQWFIFKNNQYLQLYNILLQKKFLCCNMQLLGGCYSLQLLWIK